MNNTEKILNSFPTVKPDETDLKMLAEIEAETDKSTIDYDDFITLDTMPVEIPLVLSVLEKSAYFGKRELRAIENALRKANENGG